MKRFKRILLVWDGGTPVTALFAWCRCLAAASEAEGVDGIWCRNAVIPEYPGLELPVGKPDDDDGGEVLLGAMRGFPVKVYTEDGDPLRRVLGRLSSGLYDLVIVSAHDADSRNLAERLARKSPVGVLVLPPDAIVPPEKVRLGIDYSDLSELSLDWAEAFATLKAGDGSELEAVHVMEMPRRGLETLVMDSESIFAQMSEVARVQLDEFIERKSRAPERVKKILVESHSASKVLMDQVGDPKSELTVVGCHGRNALSIALLGSHACNVVRWSESPVLIVKRKNENLGFLRELLGRES